MAACEDRHTMKALYVICKLVGAQESRIQRSN